MAGIQTSKQPKIQRVPSLLLEEKDKKDYLPKVVSIGPHHHGRPELAFVESFKPNAVQLFLSGGRQNKDYYHEKVLKIIDQIKNCYEEKSIKQYSDPYFALMMLHDASLIIIYMETAASSAETDQSSQHHQTMKESLGMMTMAILPRDLCLLDNQIPLSVIKLLLGLRYEASEDKELLNRYMNKSLFGEFHQLERISLPQQGVDSAKPLHLLQAFHMLIVSDCFERKKTSRVCFKCKWFHRPRVVKKEKGVDLEIGVHPTVPNHGSILDGLVEFLACKNINSKTYTNKDQFHSFRTVTELKAKGIHFSPSRTKSLKDVEFKSHFIYARLHLPWWAVSTYTKVFFKNMVAFELSPNSPASGEVTSYINLMKSLVDGPGDVKKLREKRILCNMLSSDEAAADVYNNIDTYGADNPEIFGRVKEQIQSHYNSKANTWIAEILHNNFRSPWATTAFFAAVALLVISAAQLHYAVHPPAI